MAISLALPGMVDPGLLVPQTLVPLARPRICPLLRVESLGVVLAGANLAQRAAGPLFSARYFVEPVIDAALVYTAQVSLASGPLAKWQKFETVCQIHLYALTGIQRSHTRSTKKPQLL